MKTSFLSFFSILTFAGVLTGCNQESSSAKGMVTTNLSVTGSGQNVVAQTFLQRSISALIPSAVALTPPLLVDSTGQNVQLNDAWIVLKKIQFKWTNDDNETNYSDDSAHYKGPFFIDLLSDTPVKLGEIVLPENGVTGVKMLLHKDNGSLPDNVPDVLRGKSIYLNGTVDGHQFTYIADDTTDFSITGTNAVTPENGKDFLVSLRLAHLFKKINLSGITSDVMVTSSSRFNVINACPDIHPTASDLYTCFKMGLNKEAKLGKDNGDNDLDADEETVN